MYQTHLKFFSEIITPSTRIWKLHNHIQNMQYMAILDKVEFDVPGGNVWSNIDKKCNNQ